MDVPHLDCLLVAAPITLEGLDHIILKRGTVTVSGTAIGGNGGARNESALGWQGPSWVRVSLPQVVAVEFNQTCIRQRPFGIAADRQGLPFLVRAPHRRLRCMANLFCTGLIL